MHLPLKEQKQCEDILSKLLNGEVSISCDYTRQRLLRGIGALAQLGSCICPLRNGGESCEIKRNSIFVCKVDILDLGECNAESSPAQIAQFIETLDELVLVLG